MSKFKELFKQAFRFGMVGIICFAVDYFGLILLTEMQVCSYFVSSGISYTASVILNYILLMKFVFVRREDMSKTKEFVVFVLLSMIGLGLTQVIMWITVEYFHIFYAIAKVLSSMIVTTYNFISKKAFLDDNPITDEAYEM